MLEFAHVVIASTKPFADVRAAVEAAIPLAGHAHQAEAHRAIRLIRSHGAPFSRSAGAIEAVVYDIGDANTNAQIAGIALGTSLYLPVRVIVCEAEGGGARIDYDLPSASLAQFGDERIAVVGRDYDVALLAALSAAAG
jgi:hypothetical protein